MLKEIGQIAINVHDVDKAIAFYRDVLGMEFLFDAPGMGFFSCGGVRLMLAKPEKEEFDHPTSIIYYRVPDMNEACETLRARGVTFEHEPALVHKTDTQELSLAAPSWKCNGPAQSSKSIRVRRPSGPTRKPTPSSVKARLQ